MGKKFVYLFSEGNDHMRELLGGKGANLAEMTLLGMPVPQGFTITTEACTQYYEDNETITWFYDTDYEFLNGDNVEQIIVSGKRAKDTIVRLLMAGVPKEKIFADRDEVESVRKYFKPKDIESVYVLYDLYAMKQKEEVHQEVKKILEDTFGKKVEEWK
mgnify:CR=1 FL=1